MSTWEEIEPILERVCYDSLLNVRLPALETINELLKDGKLDEKVKIDRVICCLLNTYTLYQDSKSKKLVTEILLGILDKEPTYLVLYLDFINENVSVKICMKAVVDYLNVLEWIHAFWEFLGNDGAIFDENVSQLLQLHCIVTSRIQNALNEVESEKTSALKQNQHRRRIRMTVLQSSSKTLVKVLDADKHYVYVEKMCNIILKDHVKLKLPTTGVVVFMGSLAKAVLQLSAKKPAHYNAFKEKFEETYLEYLGAEAILGKTPLNPYSVETYVGTFMHEFVEEADFIKYIVPSVEKYNLRSPEHSFGLCTEMYSALDPKKVDLVKIITESKILTQIFTSLKSSKDVVKEAALKSLTAALRNLDQEYYSELHLRKVVDSSFTNMKSNLNVEYKSMIAKILYAIPTYSKVLSSVIVKSLSTYVTKETNESVLYLMLEAFYVHLNNLESVNEDLLKIVGNGLNSAKAPIKKLWILSLLANISGVSAKVVTRFENVLLDFVKDTLLRPTKTGSSAVLGVLSLWTHIRSLQLGELHTSLLNTIQGITSDPLTSNSVGYAWLQVTLSTQLPAVDRLRGVEILSDLFKSYPALIGNSIAGAIQHLCIAPTEKSGEMAMRYIIPVFTLVSQEIDDKNTLRDILVKLLIPSQYNEFHVKNGWASLVIKSKEDPSELVAAYSRQIVENSSQILLNKNLLDTDVAEAAAKAISYACFINPQAMSKKVIEVLKADLRTQPLASFTQQDLEIWRGEDGTLVVDVLELQNSKKLLDKNSKDYETLSWEQSIRQKQQLQRKNVKKLTKEEQALVNEQLEKEKAVRDQVFACKMSLHRAIQIISKLTQDAIQVDNGCSEWYSVAVTRLLQVLQQKNSIELMGSAILQTFFDLSNLVSANLGTTRSILGVTILRCYGVELPSNLTEHPLMELLSTVLFRVKFVSDKKRFDTTSLAYILPLLFKVLEEGKRVAILNADKPVNRSEFIEEDKEEEHLLLALEIIGSHAEAFENPSVPRKGIFSVLISLLALPSKAKLAKDCFITLCQNISDSATKSDLEFLLSNLISPHPFVRGTILEALDEEFSLQQFMTYSPEVFICMQEEEVSNKNRAEFIWQFNEFKIDEKLPLDLLKFFDQTDSGLRLFVAKAFALSVSYLQAENHNNVDKFLDVLMDFYVEKARPAEPILDEFGLVAISAADQRDPWEERSCSAIAFKYLAQLCQIENSVKLIGFLVQCGALGDRSLLVREEMKEAGIAIIDQFGSDQVEELIPIFERSLTTETETAVKENVIILYGSLARHLEAADPRINIIVDRLLATLDTPSSDVQQAVSQCISPLVPLFSDRVCDLMDTLFEKLYTSSSPVPIRQGAAWGIAGLTKGYGIRALSEFDMIRRLVEASEDKKDQHRRESTAYAFECLSRSLGKYFEPYVIEILPNILKNLGDPVPEVRSATAEATKAIMGQTTSFGVKKLVPVAVSNLEEISWRTKRGSVELLGNMAYLDPRQLSASLSTIVPEIVGVLKDSHKEVRKAADQSLKRFGEVIRNPEIQKLVPTLIKAIGDPTNHTEAALDALIKTQFCHYIDGPSLALIIHVIHRGMRDRSANTKRKACKIVGNMAILVDKKDLVPYLQQLIEEVETAMVDPVPQTRATAARALGALVERLGEDQFPDLIPRLLDTLSDDSKSGDRLGSAQALAEVISGLGVSKLDELLPTILAGVTNFRPYIREGFLPLLIFLPVCFGTQFSPYINQIIQPILSALADSDENIRDTAMKAGKLIVKNYATKAIDLLLPELERGMFDENERIRLSSVQLAGDLLFQVTGISSHNEFAEESEHDTEIKQQMVDILGHERHDMILSSLFICRNDTSGIVRASSLDIWKALVPNTPRTIKDILPTLTNVIVMNIASSSSTMRHITAQSLGDLVRRVGGNALSQILPNLEESIKDANDSSTKQGVCVALRELIASSNAAALDDFRGIIANIIRTSLVDGDETVRESAALSFDAYQETVGKIAIDEVIPYLLNKLESADSEYALLALQEVISTKSEIIFPILIPSLLTPPVDAFKARALGSLAEVAGIALYKRLSSIISSLVNALVDPTTDSESKISIETAMDKILLSVSSEDGVHPLMQQIMSLLKSEDNEKRVVILQRLPNYFNETVLDYSVYTPDIVTQAILSLDDKDSRIVQGNFEALTALVKRQDKEMLGKLVKPARQALKLVGEPNKDLAAFTLPNGPGCILPIFLQGLVYGSSEDRESSALAIADLVSKTPASNLRPFVTVITGPLIRVVGERFSSDIKAAILHALNVLFGKIPQFLRPFIPQLQRTFVKSLSDTSSELLRLRAAKALGTLIQYQPRVDPLIVELVTSAENAKDAGVRTATLKALLEVVSKAGSKMNSASKGMIVNLVEKEIFSSDTKFLVTYAKLIGSLSEILSAEESRNILNEKVLSAGFQGETGRFAILTLHAFLKDSPSHVFSANVIDRIIEYVLKATDSPDPYFSDNGITAIGKLMLMEGEVSSPHSNHKSETPFTIGEENIQKLVYQLAKCMLSAQSNSLDSRRLSLVVVRTLARYKYSECVERYLDQLGPSLFSCLRDPIIPVKLAAEKAYLAIFKLVEEVDMSTFKSWLSRQSTDPLTNSVGTPIPLRSISDYTKRVGSRLANVERERIQAGGDAETMYSDRFDDENEIWAVGGVELKTEEL
ncbi:HCL277Wp [Eremothecium sinecaudum]|uniref:eIF-2-alpha kinase activator GCN1 n=1 Tax=Eremothecium sinecaudum TaxID=45286 RepID=A0A0X8HR25_9SACH|nr:HCL277Wp [Eremothecium sinecaudum]AMD19874.1 HCL277Wp [Eremothecium sinecaudum]